MDKTLNVALAGAGAFGIKHLESLGRIDGVRVVSLIGHDLAKTRKVAQRYGIEHLTVDLNESLAMPEVDAVILCTPTPLHARQSLACLEAGKHVQVEIPLADCLKTPKRWLPWRARKGWWQCAGIPVVSTPVTSMCETASGPASSIFSKWMCRRIFSAHES